MRLSRYPAVAFLLLASACALPQRLQHGARETLLSTPALQQAFVGICIYDPAAGKTRYAYNAHRYFTPASNTKLFTLFTGLTLLGDSSTGIRYQRRNDTLYLRGTGDPSLLHPEFPRQPALAFLQRSPETLVLLPAVDHNPVYGPGWAWDDYGEDYQPERSAMPLYGNVAWFSARDGQLQVTPAWFGRAGLLDKTAGSGSRLQVRRDPGVNRFHVRLPAGAAGGSMQVPFRVEDGRLTAALLADTLHRPVYEAPEPALPAAGWSVVPNVPLDTLFRHMMHRSDNFYAEQTLQMASMQLFDTIDTRRIIRHVLGQYLAGLPDEPRWVDGSGLSRYNLFTPADMVALLDSLYRRFPPGRLYALLPTGGTGTLSSLYRDMAGSIFAKTGSLSNNVALSGYLITRRGKTLLFSIMVGHYVCPSGEVRLAMEDFLRRVWRDN